MGEFTCQECGAEEATQRDLKRHKRRCLGDVRGAGKEESPGGKAVEAGSTRPYHVDKEDRFRAIRTRAPRPSATVTAPPDSRPLLEEMGLVPKEQAGPKNKQTPRSEVWPHPPKVSMSNLLPEGLEEVQGWLRECEEVMRIVSDQKCALRWRERLMLTTGTTTYAEAKIAASKKSEEAREDLE